MASLRDIAEQVGVSVNTVSRVFNGKTKERWSRVARQAEEIRRVAKELGYRPTTAARAVRTGRTGFLGMIHSPEPAYSVRNPAFDYGVEQELHARGLCLVHDLIDGPLRQGDQDAQLPQIVRENTVDGLLINYAYGTPPALREVLDRCHIPAIWINRKRDSNCVRPNDLGAALAATRYLIEQGHTRIGLVMLPAQPLQVERHYSVGDRRAGHEQAMREAGRTPRVFELPPVPADFNQRVGHLLRCYVQLLRQADRPSAVLCLDGGREMCHAAALAGLRVPQDLSVMTFDNEADADERVGVDRVLVRYWGMGRVAIRELCALMDRPEIPRRPVLIPLEFHRTGTVSRPQVSSAS